MKILKYGLIALVLLFTGCTKVNLTESKVPPNVEYVGRWNAQTGTICIYTCEIKGKNYILVNGMGTAIYPIEE